MTALRVVSYNVHDLHDDRRAAARVVRSLDPDVLCLQEAPRRLGGPHRVSAFAGECGLMWGGDHRGSGGTTILTSMRVDVLESRHERLPVRFPDRTRGYAVARVRLPGQPDVVVGCVHLSLWPSERQRHLRQVLADLVGGAGGRRGRGGDDRPRGDRRLALAGDLNETEGGAVWAMLGEHLRPSTPPSVTFPSRSPHRRIDAIFTGPGVRVLPHDDVPLDQDDLRAASDHLPVWADIEVADLAP
jgi:endonuclease/exonuclease/phosphatase family metal-dependent hydrolase